jgi:diguanylate cyclase (GGDEF)-like protein
MPNDDAEWSFFLESAFVAVLETADEGVFVFDRGGRCRMIGRRAGELFGIEPSIHVGKPRHDVMKALSTACEDPDVFWETIGANDMDVPEVLAVDVDLRRPRPRSLTWTSLPIVRDGAAVGRLALVRDLTRERSAERSLRQLSARLQELTPIDTLTGLLNLRRFREELEREHGRSSRAWDSYAVLRLDIDGMGAINDDYGTPVGDEVLELVAEKLKSCLREYDVLARYEGDEFCVLLPGADAVAAKIVGERMSQAVYKHAFEAIAGRRVALSVGACVWVPPSAETAEDILRRAGEAAVRAREVGLGDVIVETSAPAKSNPPRSAVERPKPGNSAPPEA